MNRGKLTKEQRYILAFSALVFIFALTKYLIAPGNMKVSFYMFELVSMTGVLLIIYYFDHVVRDLHKQISEKDAGIESLQKKIAYLDAELKQKNSFMMKETAEDVFKDVDAIFSDMPPFSNRSEFCNKALSVIGKNCEVIIGLFFVYNKQSQNFSVEGNYGIHKDEPITPFNIGEGLHGEALKDREIMVLEDVPDEYFNAYSGLGGSRPGYIYILPVADENRAAGVLELASFKPLKIVEHWEEINKKLLELITE